MTDLALWMFIGLCVLAASSGMIFGPSEWYRKLAKPTWQPPDWLFGPAWTILYGMIAIAGWLIWHSSVDGNGAVALALWGAQLALNAGWSAIFFGLRRMDLALFECGVLWIAILLTIVAFFDINTNAALLMLPYLAWVSFAFFLNWTVWRLNTKKQSVNGGLQ